jgi:hypothetical protein
MPISTAGPRWRQPALLAGALIAAFAAGAGLKLIRNSVAAPAVVVNDHPNLEITGNHERLLLLAVEENANPKPDKLREALAYHARLGMLYLDQRRYGSAEKFFDELQKRSSAPPQYTVLGYLGTAIALSFLDDADSAAKATKMFQELRGKFPQYRLLLTNVGLPPEDSINLKYWLLRALDRLAGPEGSLSPALDRLREEAKGKRPMGPPGKT